MRCLSQLRAKLKGTDRPFDYVSQFYDVLMEHVNYDTWVDFIVQRTAMATLSDPWILDLACGTGNPTLILAERGFRVMGLDRSHAMVQRACKKARDRGIYVPFCVQDMRHLALNRRADVILCLYDSMNFLLTEQDVRSAFARAAQHLNPGGVYLFDVVTERNIKLHFDGHVYREEGEGFSYEWTNRYDPGSGLCTSHLTGFCDRHGRRRPFHEFHQERIYPAEVLKTWLEEEGWRVRAVREAFSDVEPNAKSKRIHFECALPQALPC